MITTHLFGGRRNFIQNRLRCFVIPVSQGRGKRGQPRLVSETQVDLRNAQQQRNNFPVLVFDGDVQRRFIVAVARVDVRPVLYQRLKWPKQMSTGKYDICCEILRVNYKILLFNTG